MRLIKTKKSFRKEFRRQMRYAIAAAVGFMIIYAWRNAIINSVEDLMVRFVSSTEVALTNLLSALFLTLLGVLIILASSKLLKD